MKNIVCILVFMGTILLSIYSIIGLTLDNSLDKTKNHLRTSCENGEVIVDNISIPVPSGNLSATEEIPLPDLYLTGKGFTCTGLAYDENNDTYLVGEIGALQPGEKRQSSIIRLSADFTKVEEKIPLYNLFPNMEDVQGITIDTSNKSIWFCSSHENKIRNISCTGLSISSIPINRPTGIAYNQKDDSLWVLTYNNEIVHMKKNGTVMHKFAFSYDETLDQCFLDKYRGLLYITAGDNYTGRNNIYCFNVDTHEQYIACTVDSYAVEGIWLGDNNKMIILNDGYYHSAIVGRNQVNYYTLEVSKKDKK